MTVGPGATLLAGATDTGRAIGKVRDGVLVTALPDVVACARIVLVELEKVVAGFGDDVEPETVPTGAGALAGAGLLPGSVDDEAPAAGRELAEAGFTAAVLGELPGGRINEDCTGLTR